MKNPYLHLLATAWHYAKNRRKIFVLSYLMFIVGNLIYMVEPLIMAQLFNVLQEGGKDTFQDAVMWLSLFLLTPIGFWAMHGPGRVWERQTAFYIKKNFSDEMFKKVTALPLRWHKDNHSGKTYDKIYKATRALHEFSDTGFDKLAIIVRITAAFIAILYFMPFYGSLTFAFGSIIILVMNRFDKKLIKYRLEMNEYDNRIAAGLFDYISNITTVITLRLEKLAKSEILNRIQNMYPILNTNARVNEMKWFSVGICVSIMTFVLMTLYISEQTALGSGIMLGSIIALFQYIERLTHAFFEVAWQWENTVMGSTDLRGVESINTDYEKLSKKLHPIKTPKNWKTINISQLNFSYEDKKHHKHHLKEANIVLERGKKIALVGESGSGKSTLMTLLRGLDAPQSVRAFVDEKEMPDIGFLSQITTLIPQEPEIFENTIEHNVTAGVRHKKQDVTKSIKLAQFKAVAKRLPKGIATNIKERGVNLSGGEKQRLALARGIFAAKNSSIILLDEPTSSVDPTNERRIHRNLFTHFKDRCIVSSIHRLHLLPLFDTIYVLRKGKVIESGSFKKLSKEPGGHFAKLWKEYRKEN
ncbi:MAG: ABC transporter ATP-binding protein [Candidatus Gracilibacteria bacterium]|nr:ABC transporter ATP-binding protein [Candidatus Gracilibacteria bacterium]